jgi:adenylosuccinate synthase
MLDVDFGTYPFVTSSNTVTAGVCTGLGVAPGQIGEVIGIAKAYCTRVGSGPFPTELDNEMGEYLRKEGAEFGATTGRPRRCGWLDLPQLKYACMINGVTQLAITKADVLNHLEAIEVATHYKVHGQLTDQVPYDMLQQDIIPMYQSFKGWNTSLEGMQEYHSLPEPLTSYLHWIEEQVGIPVTMLSTGPERSQLITRATVTA